jgi:LysM repeat protein
MDKDIDKDMEGFVEDFAEEYGYNQYDQSDRLKRFSFNRTPIKGILALWGAAILVLSLFITLFFGGRGEVSREDLTAVNARIEEIEVKLSRIENNWEKLGSGDQSIKKSVSALEKSFDSLNKRLAGLSAKVEAVRKKAAVKTVKKESTKKVSTKKGMTTPGRGLYHTVKKGETLFGIAEKYNLTLDELLKINNLKKGHVLKVGQKLLVVPVKQ